MAKLQKYKLTDLARESKTLVHGELGRIDVDQIDDKMAEKLHKHGSRYVELAEKKEPEKKQGGNKQD